MKNPIPGRKRSIFLFVALVSCVTLLVHFDMSEAYDLSIEDERIAGENFLKDVRKYFDIVDDDFLDTYINDFGQYLTDSLEVKPFPFHFYIINDSTLNAFAGPGGHVFVFSGLIDMMESIDELAGVICHEIGHVSARHIAQRIEQNKKIGIVTLAGILAAVLIGGDAAAPMITGTAAAGVQAQLHYSREDERQADQLGFKFMEISNYHPAGMISVLQKLQQGQWPGTDVIPIYLRTHPGGPERIARIEMMLNEYAPRGEKSDAARFRNDFPIVKTILRGKYHDPYEAEKFFRMDLAKNGTSELARLGLGLVWMRRAEYEKAVEHLKIALRARPESVPILRYLGEAYQLQGRDKEAVSALQEALEINNRDKSVLYLLAASYQNLEDYAQAVRVYEKLKIIKPVKVELFYKLGIAYGRKNQLAAAHYHFGLYFKQRNDNEKAQYHFKKAAEFARHEPAWKDRIDRTMKDLHGKTKISK